MGVEPYTLFTGDNLPIMRGMDDESINLIYLDPPFNKKKDFIAPIGSKAEGAEFKDWWTMNDVKAEEIGEIGKNYPAISDLINTAGDISGESHRSYLIVMAIRLIEMKRLLKPTGSIYLHCDPTMSHWLKLLMDSVLGRNNFRNEIVWCYRGGGVPKKDFSRKHDIIFRYAKTNNITFNVDDIRQPYSEESQERLKYKARAFREDRVYDNYNMNEKGKHPEDWWVMQPIMPSSKERTGYPTQKPLALLERIIKASSNEGDIVFDPFCGCATTLVAAERINRKWIGIDQSPKGIELVNIRMKKETNLFDRFNPIFRSDIPTRAGGRRSPNIKTILYGKQIGYCAICKHHFRYQNLTIDHINPKNKGGGEEDTNKQLLCGHCNSVKGGRRTNAETKVRLKEINTEYAKHP